MEDEDRHYCSDELPYGSDSRFVAAALTVLLLWWVVACIGMVRLIEWVFS
jgi:hypothetical protein